MGAMRRGVWTLSGTIAAAALQLAGCGGGGNAGQVAVSASGGEAVTKGLPYSKGAQSVAFADGWTLQWRKYLVSLGHLQLRGADGAKAADLQQRWVVDLHQGDAPLSTIVEVPARRWERLSYEVVPVAEGARLGPGVAESDAERMLNGRLTHWLEGTATKDGRTVTFAWGLALPTTNADCVDGTDGQPGVPVSDGATTTAQLTFHAEHLFFTTLGSEQAPLRFEPIAAKADTSGVVDLDKLKEQSLSAPKDAAGEPILDEQGQPVVYDAKGAPLAENDLKGFLLASAAAQGHLGGQGLCTITATK